MKKTATFISCLLVMALFTACDDHDNAPEPIKQLRAQSASYGDQSYRIFNYDDQNRVTSITSGIIDDGDSAEIIHSIIYDGNKIDRFEITNQSIIDYIYDGDRVTETREYLHGPLVATHFYTYNAAGRVTTWEIKRAHLEGDDPVPDGKYVYAYNNDGNLVTQQYYVFDGPDYRLLHTITFEDFDDKKNSDPLFLADLYNPQHIKFKNNPRTWHLVNATSGATAEEHFQFEYNEQGYVTRSIPDQGSGVTYRFTEF
jgi:hypothetical protein